MASAAAMGVTTGTAQAHTQVVACAPVGTEVLNTGQAHRLQGVTATLCVAPNETVTGTFDLRHPQQVFQVTTAADGTATVTFEVPGDACHEHTVTAVGATSNKTATAPLHVIGCRQQPFLHGRHHGFHRGWDGWGDFGVEW